MFNKYSNKFIEMHISEEQIGKRKMNISPLTFFNVNTL
jgi:hypothetical protein